MLYGFFVQILFFRFDRFCWLTTRLQCSRFWWIYELFQVLAKIVSFIIMSLSKAIHFCLLMQIFTLRWYFPVTSNFKIKFHCLLRMWQVRILWCPLVGIFLRMPLSAKYWKVLCLQCRNELKTISVSIDRQNIPEIPHFIPTNFWQH